MQGRNFGDREVGGANPSAPINRIEKLRLPFWEAFLFIAPGMAHSLGGESPLRTRQGESLAGRQGCPPRGGIRRKPQAKRWPDEQKPHKRRQSWMRRLISSKSNTCTESYGVDAAGISGKVSAQYPGRPVVLPCARVVERRRDEKTGVSRGHSRQLRPRRRPEHVERTDA
jgi:hypothetical protein